MPTGAAERIAAGVVVDQPVARSELGIRAVDELLVRQSWRREVIAVDLERDEHIGLMPVAQGVATVLADGVLEIEDVVTVVAAEEFH